MARPKRTKQCRTCGATFVTAAGFADCNPCRYAKSGKSKTCISCGAPVDNRSESSECRQCWTTSRSGDKAASWKGGRTIHKPSGYVLVKDPDHPNARSDGYVREHVKVASETIGRPLYAHEDVHHINHDKTDNRPENLMVLTRAEHTRLHQHERTGTRPLTDADRDRIVSVASANGYPPGRRGRSGNGWAQALADEYGVAIGTIYRAARGFR